MARKSLLESRLGKNAEVAADKNIRTGPEINKGDSENISTSPRPKKEKRKKEKPAVYRKIASRITPDEPQPYTVEYEQSIKNAEIMDESDREAQEREQKHRDERKVARAKKRNRIITGILAAACAYLIFMIYGVLMTSYTYDDMGNVVAQTYTVDDIRQRTEDEKVIGYYQLCRELYENVLVVDYQFEAGAESYATIGGNYTALLDRAENLYSQISGANVDTQYNQITDMMAIWLSDYLRNYLQNIATYCGYNGGDETSGNNAIVYNTATYEYFSNITQNIVSMGEGIKGIDLDDIKVWSPDTYIDIYINGESDS